MRGSPAPPSLWCGLGWLARTLQLTGMPLEINENQSFLTQCADRVPLWWAGFSDSRVILHGLLRALGQPCNIAWPLTRLLAHYTAVNSSIRFENQCDKIMICDPTSPTYQIRKVAGTILGGTRSGTAHVCKSSCMQR